MIENILWIGGPVDGDRKPWPVGIGISTIVAGCDPGESDMPRRQQEGCYRLFTMGSENQKVLRIAVSEEIKTHDANFEIFQRLVRGYRNSK